MPFGRIRCCAHRRCRAMTEYLLLLSVGACGEDEGDVEEEEGEVELVSDEDEEAPDVVVLEKAEGKDGGEKEAAVIDLSKMTPE